jgi:uncharacterized protein YecT (DUF1311 family)
MLLGMYARLILAFTLLAGALPVFAQLDDADDATRAACKEAIKTPLPAEAAQVMPPKSWPECNSYKLYSGIGTKVDYGAARKCAWQERLAQLADLEPRFSVASVFGGSAMLTVLYANGNGVDRNIPLALRFACEAGGAPAEIDGRLAYLESIRKGDSARTPHFDFCDDITSGFMMGFCAARSSELGDRDRSHDLSVIEGRMTPAQKEAFSHLVNSQSAYAHAHAAGEIDLSGTARAMYQIDAEDTLRDDFIAALQSFEAGKPPSGNSETYRDADEQLNTAYGKTIADADKHKTEYGAVQPSLIRDAEREWLKYRDAFVAFAKLRYHAVPAEAWLTLLTKDRTSVIDGSFCDMDAEDGPCAQKGDKWNPSPLP